MAADLRLNSKDLRYFSTPPHAFIMLSQSSNSMREREKWVK
jgi:hypothetical protein